MEMFMKKFMISIAAICAMFFFISCGGSSETKDGEKTDKDEVSDSENPDSEVEDSEVKDEEVADSEVTDEETTDTEEPDEPEELAYPEVTPKSNKEGDIAQNITIYDDVDVKHTLAEWYQPNNPSSKLIWLIFTTYDCPPCKILKEDLLEINLREYRDQGLKILVVFNGLLSGPQPELEPEKVAEYKDIYLSEYPDTGRFELYGYLRDEEQKVLKKFFSSPMGGSYPTYAFIDASTMEIVEWGEGWGDNMVNSTKSKIEILLEEL
jgi:thiol-disulfide isomerase/thioredoxin